MSTGGLNQPEWSPCIMVVKAVNNTFIYAHFELLGRPCHRGWGRVVEGDTPRRFFLCAAKPRHELTMEFDLFDAVTETLLSSRILSNRFRNRSALSRGTVKKFAQVFPTLFMAPLHLSIYDLVFETIMTFYVVSDKSDDNRDNYRQMAMFFQWKWRVVYFKYKMYWGDHTS